MHLKIQIHHSCDFLKQEYSFAFDCVNTFIIIDVHHMYRIEYSDLIHCTGGMLQRSHHALSNIAKPYQFITQAQIMLRDHRRDLSHHIMIFFIQREVLLTFLFPFREPKSGKRNISKNQWRCRNGQWFPAHSAIGDHHGWFLAGHQFHHIRYNFTADAVECQFRWLAMHQQFLAVFSMHFAQVDIADDNISAQRQQMLLNALKLCFRARLSACFAAANNIDGFESQVSRNLNYAFAHS
mmetsp:Transcript_11656/g.17631  ORF Transcript_11656/g.17631 Transcript_11656/m.17631 type:complete len:238 (-) Transcript_11656:654-1367(-)